MIKSVSLFGGAVALSFGLSPFTAPARMVFDGVRASAARFTLCQRGICYRKTGLSGDQPSSVRLYGTIAIIGAGPGAGNIYDVRFWLIPVDRFFQPESAQRRSS